MTATVNHDNSTAYDHNRQNTINMKSLNESEDGSGVKRRRDEKKQKESKTKTCLAHPTNFNYQRACLILDV